MDVITTLLLTRDGRIGRLIYLVSSLVWSIVGTIVIEIATFALLVFVVGMVAVSPVAGALVGLVALVAFLALLFGYVLVAVNLMAKRLHDFNWSGSIAVVAVMAQILATGLVLSRNAAAMGLGATAILALLLFWLALLVVPGSDGVNDYGDRMRVRIE